MPESDDMQRFDRLLDVMVNEPPLEAGNNEEPVAAADLREDDE